MYIPSESFPSPPSDPPAYLLNHGDRLKKVGMSGGGRCRKDEVVPRRYFHHTDEEIQLELARIRAENGIWGRRGGF
ncbi:hypothetical protein I302_106824 [Kwoniella bestiolae CBS 10118]|uniref:Uncharacterized protein n=1 Tax=Kwoniella bestiolae CBS 10118 TaxID=1296100 RepID=A0AAJ8KCF9_9TREE